MYTKHTDTTNIMPGYKVTEDWTQTLQVSEFIGTWEKIWNINHILIGLHLTIIFIID